MTAARKTAEPLLFELEIERQGMKLRARVRNSVRGMGEQIFALPPELASLGDLGRRQGQLRNLAPPAAARAAEALRKDALAVGEKLFAACFQGSVGQAFRASQAVAQATGRPLAVVLRLKREVLPLAVPWEILTDPLTGQPLATSATTPLLRSLEGLTAPECAAPPERVEVLVGIASPAGYTALATECEWLSIRAATEGRAASLEPERLSELSVTALRERLRRGTCRVFHFIGHGEIDAATGESSLVFEGEGRQPVLLDGGSLAAILAPSGRSLDGGDSVRLAVLNACDGAAVSESEALGGVAQQLLRRGVPAVVAMRAAIRDTSAVEFSRVFYRELASSRPVEVAVALAREALYKEPGGVDWALPVLLAAGPVGPLVADRARGTCQQL